MFLLHSRDMNPMFTRTATGPIVQSLYVESHVHPRYCLAAVDIYGSSHDEGNIQVAVDAARLPGEIVAIFRMAWQGPLSFEPG